VVAVVAALALWTAYAFAQEAYIGHKLSQQVADLYRQNALLSSQNSGYRKDVESMALGAANEEEARQNGYARAGERVYLVTEPPSPAPPSPHASPTH
jgi:cell division protein FtsB